MAIPSLGVGLVYDSIFDPLLDPALGLVDVLEIEPQTFFIEHERAGGPLELHEEYVEHLAAFPQPKIVHSVGVPVGSSLSPDARQLPLLRRVNERFDPPWWSEHVAFNRAMGDDEPFWTSFLLPPLLDESGLRSAVRAVQRLMALEPERPFAVETPVHYLAPRSGEMPYGEFIGRLCEQTGCGVLLDLHNILANERNGREPVERVLEALDADRIWEIHLAGGFSMEGMYLDAHSGVCDEELTELTRAVLPRLPRLGALIFEMLEPFVAKTGLEPVTEQLVAMRELWALRGTELRRPSPSSRSATELTSTPPEAPVDAEEPLSSEAWERSLGELVIGRSPAGPLARQLADDPGVDLMRYLVGTFRSGYLADGLPMTLRLLLMSVGEERTRALMQAYWETAPPQIFGTSESRLFAEHLERHSPDVPYLAEVVAIERAALDAKIDGQTTTLTLEVDPIALMRELGEGRIPEDLERGHFELVMEPPQDEVAASA